MKWPRVLSEIGRMVGRIEREIRSAFALLLNLSKNVRGSSKAAERDM